MKKKILFVLTSHGELGNTGKTTGYHLQELSHPWKVLTDAGYEIDFVSPKGGEPPVDFFDLSEPTNKEFWENETYKQKRENTFVPSEIKTEDYTAVYYVGGHGTVYDLPDHTELQEITRKIYENNGVVGAVCHGPSGLVNIKLSNGQYLVADKKVNSFTNEEEREMQLENEVPFLIETTMIERGAKWEGSGKWQPHVTADQRLVTGQNPFSAKGVGEAILNELQKL
ncbi:type 1 glutamine amidotransferase domain-containing protein [Flavobacterium anhuiense]|uniref:type 1 glutamine amidotransferase domain-containing protein n=1 Tax=Flavobacterium anhuiense TaxID=459526 RepID=UPI003D98A0CF